MRIAASLVIVLLAACSPPQQGYPPQIELNFRNACEAQSPPDGLCSCVWSRIEADVEPGDLMALERLPINERQSHALTEQINGYALACRAQLQGAPEEPSPAP